MPVQRAVHLLPAHRGAQLCAGGASAGFVRGAVRRAAHAAAALCDGAVLAVPGACDAVRVCGLSDGAVGAGDAGAQRACQKAGRGGRGGACPDGGRRAASGSAAGGQRTGKCANRFADTEHSANRKRFSGHWHEDAF